tara:strand:+ start:6765 stop:7133 length:369 start_codon:yes stop_codon:yes gene_type:complete
MKHELSYEYKDKEYLVSLDLTDKPVITDYSIIGNKEPTENIVTKKSGCTSCSAKKLKRFIDGGIGLLKSELGIDACDQSTIIDRKDLCLKCEHYDFGVCNSCGCFCAAKVKLKSERCPKGKW